MLHPPDLIRNRIDEQELARLVMIGTPICIITHLPFGFVYPMILGKATIDPFWERIAVSFISSIGLILPHFRATRLWIQAFLYFLCFLYSAHLFSLAVRNDLHVAYQLGYVCVLAIVAYYLDTNFMYGLYALFNYFMVGISLFSRVSYETLFFTMIITTLLSVQYVALLSRLRIAKALEDSRAEVIRGARKIQSILENIPQGVLTIESPDGRLGNERSTYLHTLLNTGPDQTLHLHDILRYTDLSKDQIEQVQAAVACIIQEDEVAFAMNYHLFPRTLIERQGGLMRQFELDWNPTANNGVITSLLVCIRDVTELQRLRTDAARGQRELQLLGELVNIPHEQRVSVLEASENLLDSARQAGEKSLPHVLRMMHTMKGNARTFGLLALADAAHVCENQLNDDHGISAETFQNLQDVLQAYRRIAAEKLGHKETDDQLSLPRDRLMAVISDLEQSKLRDHKAIQQLLTIMHEALHTRIHQVLEPHLRSLPQLALQLGKVPPIVHIVDPGIELQQESADFLSDIFLHLLRNSLDHGLEPAHERLKSGKSPEGHIWLVLKPRPHGLEVHVNDDGRGLDLQTIRRKAEEKGLFASTRPLDQETLANLIFHAGFSTKDTITDISGRGIGLDAVRHRLNEAGGSIRLVLDPSQDGSSIACTFILEIPEHCLAQWKALAG